MSYDEFKRRAAQEAEQALENDLRKIFETHMYDNPLAYSAMQSLNSRHRGHTSPLDIAMAVFDKLIKTNTALMKQLLQMHQRFGPAPDSSKETE